MRTGITGSATGCGHSGPAAGRPTARWLPRLIRELGCGEACREAVSRAARRARRCPREEWNRLRTLGLNLTQIFILLRVRDGPTRRRLEQRALEEGWSCSRLQAEVRRARGYCGQKGGKAARIQSHGAADDLRELLHACRQWLARYDRLWSPGKQRFPARLQPLPDPGHTERLTRDVKEALKKLAELSRAAEALRRGLAKRAQEQRWTGPSRRHEKRLGAAPRGDSPALALATNRWQPAPIRSGGCSGRLRRTRQLTRP